MNAPANGLLVSLIRAGIIQDGQSGLLQERARNEKKTLVTYLIDNDIITSSQLAELCEQEYHISSVRFFVIIANNIDLF